MNTNEKKLTHTKVWTIAVPVILSNISIPLLDATNTGIMGHLDSPVYLAALAIAISIISYIYVSFNFLRMGTTGLAAQAFGSNNHNEIVGSLIRNLSIGVLIGILITILQYPISAIALKIFQGSQSVEALANDYLQVRMLGAFAALGNFVLIGWLLGIQRPKTSLLIQAFMNGLNIILAFWFVLNLGMGMKGAALATVISEFFAFLLGVIIVYAIIKKDYSDIKINLSQTFSTEKIKRIFNVNSNIFIRSMLLMTAFAWFTNVGAKQGETILAANEILILLILFLSFALDGFAQSAEVFVGEAIGNKDASHFNDSIKKTTLWALIFAMLFSLTYSCLGKLIVYSLTDIESVRQTTLLYLPWLVVLPLIGVWCYQLDGIFIGATQTADMRNMMLVSFVIYGIAIFAFTPTLGNHGLWLALIIFLAIRGMTLYYKLPNIKKQIS